MGDMDGVTWSRHRRENFPFVFISFLSPLRLVKGDIEHIYTQSHSSSCTRHRNGRSPLAMTMKETKNIVTTDELPSVPVAHTLDSLPFECRICQAPAKYSYFGAIACRSCKMFFKRNAIGAKVLSLVSSRLFALSSGGVFVESHRVYPQQSMFGQYPHATHLSIVPPSQMLRSRNEHGQIPSVETSPCCEHGSFGEQQKQQSRSNQ